MAASPVEAYLDRLAHELRARRTPRRRLLAEAEDHLRSTAEELVTRGCSAVDAEREAIERFGDAPEVAHRFALATASSTARSAVGWAAAAFFAYGASALVFLATAPVWLRDFPHGAPSTLALQVAAVALGVTTVRVLRWRRGRVLDEERVRLVANGAVTAAVAVAIGAGAELLVALTRPAAAPWGEAAAPIGMFAVAAVLCVPAALVAAASRARAGGLGGRGDAGLTLADDFEAVAPVLGRLARTALRRPGLTCAAVAGSAFAAVTIAQLAASDASLFFGAAAVGLFEATAIVIGFLTLGRPLGLRARRHSQ
jgi:uncharacterized membrane protein